MEVAKAIEKGGNVRADNSNEDGFTNFNLRISKKMLRELDEALTETVGISKTGWILQAIQDKLKKQKE